MHGKRRSHKRLYFVKIIDLRRRRRDCVCATPKYICQAGPIVPPCARSICDIVTVYISPRLDKKDAKRILTKGELIEYLLLFLKETRIGLLGKEGKEEDEWLDQWDI